MTAVPSSLEPDANVPTNATFDGASVWSQVSNQAAQLSWVFAGKLALIGANALVMLFLANRLELNTYGLLVITISGQLLISRVLMSGVDAGMVRLTAIPDLRLRSGKVVAAGLVFIACTSGVLIVVWILATPALSYLHVSPWLSASTVGGAIGLALVDYGYSFRLARHDYSFAALAQGGTAIWRLGCTAVAATQFPSSPYAIFIAYHGSSLLSGLVQTFLILKHSERPERTLLKRLLGYSLWLGKANVIVIFSLYQGTLLLMALNQPAETGVFGLALTLSFGFFALYSAFSEYLCVRVRALDRIDEMPPFIKRGLKAAVVLMGSCALITVAVASVMPWLLGPHWRDIVPVFVYLSASMVLLMLQAPLVAACHYILKPHLITISWLQRVLFIGVAGIILAPQHGAVGAAIGQLIGSALALAVSSWLVAVSLRSAMNAELHS